MLPIQGPGPPPGLDIEIDHDHCTALEGRMCGMTLGDVTAAGSKMLWYKSINPNLSKQKLLHASGISGVFLPSERSINVLKPLRL